MGLEGTLLLGDLCRVPGLNFVGRCRALWDLGGIRVPSNFFVMDPTPRPTKPIYRQSLQAILAPFIDTARQADVPPDKLQADVGPNSSIAYRTCTVS